MATKTQMAAAPDLLAALVRIENQAGFDTGESEMSLTDRLLEIGKVARAAIAKAVPA